MKKIILVIADETASWPFTSRWHGIRGFAVFGISALSPRRSPRPAQRRRGVEGRHHSCRPLCLLCVFLLRWAGQGGRQSCGEVRGLVVSLATPRWALQVSVTCHGKLLRIELLKYDTSLKHRLLCSLLKTSAQQLQRLPLTALEYLFPSGPSPSTARGKGASATRPSDRKPGCRRPAGPHSWGCAGGRAVHGPSSDRPSACLENAAV